jgi:hypothetical protein
MDHKSISDQIVADLKAMPKRMKSPNAKTVTKGKHTERNIEVVTLAGFHSFTLIERQATFNPYNFSCGLIWKASKSQHVILARYNGSNHPHTNHIEGDEFEYSCHIHIATERYIEAGHKPEHYAQKTDRYSDLQGAIKCLLEDWNIEAPKKSIKKNQGMPEFIQSNLFV